MLTLSALVFRGFSSAFTLLARLSPDIDEVWALPDITQHDFLLVFSPSAPPEAAEKKWRALFEALSAAYARGPERRSLSLLTAEEWETLHPLFTARGATRGLPLFQRQRWKPLPEPAHFNANVPLKDRLHRALTLFTRFQVLLRQHGTAVRAERIWVTRLRRNLEQKLSCQIPHDSQWSARFLRRLNQLAESLHGESGTTRPGFMPSTEGPSALPDGFSFADKQVVRFARQGEEDFWIVSPLFDDDYERAVEAYRTTTRKFSLLSPEAFHSLHQNYPFREWHFYEAVSDKREAPVFWSDPDRVAIEVLEAALAHPRAAASHGKWNLADVEKGWGRVYKEPNKGTTHEDHSPLITDPLSVFHGGPRRRA